MLTSSAASGGGDYARANLRNFQVFVPEVGAFATHHSKFLVAAYASHVRVCVHTANYLGFDWADMSEGVWMQDFPLKAAGAGKSAFEDDLVDYMKATRWPGGALADGSRCGADSLRAYDYSGARVALVASVPGSHGDERYGQRRVRALLQRETFDARAVGAPMVWQYTSNGAVRDDMIMQLRRAFSAGRTAAGAPLGLGSVKVVWPTEQEVRRSYEGWSAGTSIPGERKNIRLPEMRELHHRWAAEGGRDSCPEGRSRAMPHIKTFLRFRDSTIFWMILGSHNMSKAAWGFETKAGSLTIGSYELGVMFLPSLLPPGTEMRCTAGAPAGLKGSTLGLRVPYALPPLPYGPADEPWDWQTPRQQQDTHGRTFPGR
jgi:tyrosyl-DNA phosphodiesterase-1